MLHKISAGSATSRLSSHSEGLSGPPAARTGLHLAHPGQRRPAQPSGAPAADLVPILSRRCSSFCAEAAVLVLVFGLLDYFMAKGHIELPWIAGALLASLLLLALSILIELSAHRWIKAHP